MIATERQSTGIISKSCFVLVEFLAMSYIKYLDFDLNEKNQKISPEQYTIREILSNLVARKIQPQAPTKKDVKEVKPVKQVKEVIKEKDIVKENKNVVPAEILKKSEAARRRNVPTTPKPTEASPALSIYAEIALKKAEREQLPLGKRYSPLVPSLLGQNRLNYNKPTEDSCLSKRHLTPASEKPKRTTTMKFINSTAANRAMKTKNRKQRKEDDDETVKRRQKAAPKQKRVNVNNNANVKPVEVNEKNLNLYDERPLLSQRPRTLQLNKSPEANLQHARKCLKLMIKVRKHRYTI